METKNEVLNILDEVLKALDEDETKGLNKAVYPLNDDTYEETKKTIELREEIKDGERETVWIIFDNLLTDLTKDYPEARKHEDYIRNIIGSFYKDGNNDQYIKTYFVGLMTLYRKGLMKSKYYQKCLHYYRFEFEMDFLYVSIKELCKNDDYNALEEIATTLNLIFKTGLFVRILKLFKKAIDTNDETVISVSEIYSQEEFNYCTDIAKSILELFKGFGELIERDDVLKISLYSALQLFNDIELKQIRTEVEKLL